MWKSAPIVSVPMKSCVGVMQKSVTHAEPSIERNTDADSQRKLEVTAVVLFLELMPAEQGSSDPKIEHKATILAANSEHRDQRSNERAVLPSLKHSGACQQSGSDAPARRVITLPRQPDTRHNVVFTKRFGLLLAKYAFASNARPNANAVQPMQFVGVAGPRCKAAEDENRYESNARPRTKRLSRSILYACAVSCPSRRLSTIGTMLLNVVLRCLANVADR